MRGASRWRHFCKYCKEAALVFFVELLIERWQWKHCFDLTVQYVLDLSILVTIAPKPLKFALISGMLKFQKLDRARSGRTVWWEMKLKLCLCPKWERIETGTMTEHQTSFVFIIINLLLIIQVGNVFHEIKKFCKIIRRTRVCQTYPIFVKCFWLRWRNERSNESSNLCFVGSLRTSCIKVYVTRS